jgi:ABC-2 type transport system permease protein
MIGRWRSMLLAVMRKEVRQTVRDRRMMFILVVVPAIQLIVFGVAVNFDVDRVPAAIVDLDRSHASRTHVRRLFADGTITAVAWPASVQEADAMLVSGDLSVVLVIPSGFERDLARGQSTTVQAIVDGSNPNRANVAAAAIATYFARESDSAIRLRVARAAGTGQRVVVPDLSIRSRVLFNPELDTAVYMVPGIMAMLLLIVTTIVTAMGLARERERGTLEQIMVTPVPAPILIFGKILPFAVIGLVDVALALVVGSYVFGMPMRGDLALLFTGTFFYLLTTLGAGLLVASLSRSQQQAFMLGFLFMLPAALLSGIMSPIRSMPEWLQWLTVINPLRHYQEITRGVLLRGAGIEQLYVQLGALALIGVIVFTFASLRFRRSVG